MLVLYRLLAGGQCIVAARRGALQCINRVLRSLPCFVVSEVLGHVVKIFLFSDQRRFEDTFGLLDQRPSSLDFRATRVIHNPFLSVRRVIPREFRRQPFNKSLVELDLKRTDLGKSAKDSAEWAREARADEVRGSLLQAGPKVDEAIRSAAWYY